jgi:hypothetical protein
MRSLVPEGTRPLQLKPTGPRTDESGNPLSQEAYGANMMFKSQEDFDAGYQNYLSQFNNQPQGLGRPLGGGITQIDPRGPRPIPMGPNTGVGPRIPATPPPLQGGNPILQIMQTGSPTPKPAQPATQPGVLSGGFASPAPSLTLAETAQESASSNTIMPTVEPVIENTASVEPISSTNEAISNPTETNNVGSTGIKGIVDNYIKNYIDNYFKNNFK